MMVRWMCGVTLRSKVRSEELWSRIYVGSVFVVVRHITVDCDNLVVKRKSDDNWVKMCQQVVIEGKSGRGEIEGHG